MLKPSRHHDFKSNRISHPKLGRAPPHLRNRSLYSALKTDYASTMPTGAYRSPRTADELIHTSGRHRNGRHTNRPAVAAQPSTPAVRIGPIPGAGRFGPALATKAVTTTMAAVLCLAFDPRRLAVMFAIPNAE